MTISAVKTSILSTRCRILANSAASSLPVYKSRAFLISLSIDSRKYWLVGNKTHFKELILKRISMKNNNFIKNE